MQGEDARYLKRATCAPNGSSQAEGRIGAAVTAA